MRRFFLVPLLVFIIGTAMAIQPERKPFIQLTIDGNPIKNGEVFTVTPGQKIIVGAEISGGRRDFCKFPDTYADITETAQILSRGKDGITYLINGKSAEWKLLNENIEFAGDDFIQLKSDSKQSPAEITFSKTPFSQSVLKVSIKATWQFSQNDQTNQEENKAETMLYFKVAGTSDMWFSTHDLSANGIKNELIQEKLMAVQAAADTIENYLNLLSFSKVQQAIRVYQANVNAVKTTLDEVKASSPSYKTKITIIGLPSDNTFKILGSFSLIKGNWETLEPLVQSLKKQLDALPATTSKESEDTLIKLISTYLDWQNKLPENSFTILPIYIPDLKPEDIQLPENIHSAGDKKSISSYEMIVGDFKTYLDKRIEQVPLEIPKINSTHTRLQAVRLFDGMLRSYISSISWAEWKNTRE
jgi:hypothetical protein